MDQLTITGTNKMTKIKEPLIDHQIMFPLKSFNERGFIFEKPTVFLSSRVHPGEVPASHVLNGIINFLI